MTYPESDQILVDFLRQNCPVAPAADPLLENRIMADLTLLLAAPARPGFVLDARPPRPWKRWAVPPAIAATVLITWMGFQAYTNSQKPTNAELAQLESFVEDTWGVAVYDDSTASGNSAYSSFDSEISLIDFVEK
jgi:rhodanese-related sulfurtransferase